MSDKLPPLPEHTGYMAHNYDLRSWDENDLRTYAAQAVAERDAEIASLREANERFGKRQEWWTEKMFELEQERDALKADADKHYAAGWIAAAKWAERDDLISDIDSPAYIADRDAAIDNARSKE